VTALDEDDGEGLIRDLLLLSVDDDDDDDEEEREALEMSKTRRDVISGSDRLGPAIAR